LLSAPVEARLPGLASLGFRKLVLQELVLRELGLQELVLQESGLREPLPQEVWAARPFFPFSKRKLFQLRFRFPR
jgi:hypothetical protein